MARLSWPRSLTAALVGLVATACATTGGTEQKHGPGGTPPAIHATMPLDKALEAAINFGGDTLTAVKRLVHRRQEGATAAKLLEPALREGILQYEQHQLLNVANLYASMPVPLQDSLFRELVGSGRPLARQVGWQLAAAKPSAAITRAIDIELTRAVADNDLESVLIPQMANAVRANGMSTAYTVLRQGLMSKGDEEFAAAMIALEPLRASEDFMVYLSLAPADELRQLTLSSVNLYTAVAALQHFQKMPPSVANPHFAHLFVYAVSRNAALAELAQKAIEAYLPSQTEAVAHTLARQPVWVQIAYLENARRRMNVKQSLLLSELKKATAENDVVREIEQITL